MSVGGDTTTWPEQAWLHRSSFGSGQHPRARGRSQLSLFLDTADATSSGLLASESATESRCPDVSFALAKIELHPNLMNDMFADC